MNSIYARMEAHNERKVFMKGKWKLGLILFLALLCCAAVASAGMPLDEATVPDPVFREYLKQFDQDGDDFLVPDEYEAIKEINCKDLQIKSAKGIELLENLESASFWNCPLQSLDVTHNDKLSYLDVCDAHLSALDVTGNPLLTQLWCYGNNFTTLDISNCPKLVSAARKGVHNNNYNDGSAYSFADDDVQSYLVVDKKVTIKLSDTEKIDPPADAPVEDPDNPDVDPDHPGDDPEPPIEPYDPPVAEGTCGNNLTWRLNSEGVLTISGTGEMSNWVYYTPYIGGKPGKSYITYPWKDVISQIKTVYIQEGVTTIGRMAFGLVTTMKTIIIPRSLNRVYNDAFNGCGVSQVYYAGSETEWFGITKETHNNALNDASRHYNVSAEKQEDLLHTWGTVEYTWSSDCKQVTASRVCLFSSAHVQSETVDTEQEIIPATTKAEGKIIYTATFSREAFEPQTREVTIPKLPKAVTGLSLKAGKKQLTVRWKKSAGVSGYEIQYGLKKNFKGAKTVTVSKAKTVKKVIKGLKKGKTYYVRIRAFNTVNGSKYYSAWSKALKAKVK